MSVPDLSVQDRTSALRDFGDVFEALDWLPVPVFAIRRDGVISWLNMAAEREVGSKAGVPFTHVVAPESQAVVRNAFASKTVGGRESSEYEAVLLRDDGSRVDVEICSVPVRGDGGIVGVFGFVRVEDAPPRRPELVERHLTPRQAEVLRYLARGYKTSDMAAAMGIAVDTVRNHVRGLLVALGVHSRLEAVTTARMQGLV